MGNIKVRNSGAFTQMKNVKARSGGSLVQAKKVAVRSSGAWVTALNFLPETPTLTASNTTAYANTLTWTAPASFFTITNYTLQRSPDNSTWATVFTGTGLTYIDTGLTENTTYYYRILANTAINSGSYSSVVTQATRVATIKRQTFNSTGTWTKPAGVTTVDALVVANGQNGGNTYYTYDASWMAYIFDVSYGGGGGKVTYQAGVSVTASPTYSCVVGSTSSFAGITSTGTGGSGGSASRSLDGSGSTILALVTTAAGSGVSGTYAGAAQSGTYADNLINKTSGGGGGNTAAASGRIGGAGYTSDISGTSTVYGKGGDGLTMNVGLNGTKTFTGTSTTPTANTGNGGHAGVTSGADVYSGSGTGKAGATGVVILRWYD
jgi:hypothetical protein